MRMPFGGTTAVDMRFVDHGFLRPVQGTFEQCQSKNWKGLVHFTPSVTCSHVEDVKANLMPFCKAA